MTVAPSVPSVEHSSISGVKLNVNGNWESVPDAVAANGVGKDAREAEARAFGWDPDAKNNVPTLQVGDTVRIAPTINDAFGNRVEVPGRLEAFLLRPDGLNEEIDMSGFKTRVGPWSYEARYELDQKGEYKLKMLLDQAELPGSPVTWTVEHRSWDGKRAFLPV